MLQDTRVFSFFRSQLISFSLLILCTTGVLFAAPRAEVLDAETACEGAVFLDDITWLDGRLDGYGDQIYALSLDQKGLLNAEATHLGEHPEQPRLEILDGQCRPLHSAFAIHQGHRAALIPSSETYYLRVAGLGTRAATDYRLQIAFAPMSQLAGLPSTSTQKEEPTDPWEEGASTRQARLYNGIQDKPVEEEEPTDPWEEGASTQQARLYNGIQDKPVEEEEPTDPWEEGASNQQARLYNGIQDKPVEEEEPTDPWEEGASTQQARLYNGIQDKPVEEEEPTDPWEEGASTQQARLYNGIQDKPVEEEEPTDPWEEMVDGGSVDVLAAFADWRRSQTTSSWQTDSHRLNVALETALCPRLSHGDDGDTLGCATEMRLGGQLQADMQHGDLEDRDTYTFVLHQRAQITLASRGDLDLRGMLYDAEGQQLVIDDEGAGYGNFRLQATLDAGRYYLRVDSLDRYNGNYELLSAIAPEAWQLAESR